MSKMSDLEKLKAAKSIHDLAPLIDFKPKGLAYLLFKAPSDEKYIQFTIPKKAGGVRIINAPQNGLKLAQRRLADILNSCVEEIEKNHPSQKPLAHGFKKKASDDKKNASEKPLALGIHTNAKCHKNRRYVLNLDLADFFPAFNFGRVRGFFIHNKDFQLSPKVATLIAQTACHNNELPQGSPCSPIITNFIAHILDVHLAQWAKKYKCTYSRYADDITFSTNNKNLPQQLAIPSDHPNQWRVGQPIEDIITKSGFSVNHAKTRLQFRQSRQMVTGLVVNRKVNIQSAYYRHVRSMCHALFSTGSFHMPNIPDMPNNPPGSMRQLEGILNYIYFIKKFSLTDAEKELHEENKEKAKKDNKPPKQYGVTRLYSRFLYFRYFFALERPLILCEGKTDVIYLKTAIKQLTKGGFQFPKVDFFPFTPRVSEVMCIHEGSSALKNFIEHYAQNTNFKAFKWRKPPVIVLLDNDKGAGDVINLLKKKFKKSCITYDRNRTFRYYVISNLYVVLLPKQKSYSFDNKIEDFLGKFKEACELANKGDLVKDTKRNGKTFCPDNKNKKNSDKNKKDSPKNNNKKDSAEGEEGSDNEKNYGKYMKYDKYILATRVVRRYQDSIDFEDFKPILEELSKVIMEQRIT